MITSNKHLLYILGVDQTQLEYILANLESFYYSFEREKVDKITGKPKLENGEPTFRKINSSQIIHNYLIIHFHFLLIKLN